VVLASQGFVLQFLLGGQVPLIIGYGQISATMAGVHALIGVGEGLIAAATVTTVAKVRPDLVYALRGARLERPATGGLPVRTFVLGGLGVAAVLAGGVSYLASGSPDGLDATTLAGCTVDADGVITGGSCIAQRAQDHEIGGTLLADYGIKGLDDATGLAGLIGVALTFAAGLAIFWAARRRRTAAAGSAPSTAPAER
jgi:hypothetical protein